MTENVPTTTIFKKILYASSTLKEKKTHDQCWDIFSLTSIVWVFIVDKMFTFYFYSSITISESINLFVQIP